MTFASFPALLRSNYNMIHEYGDATISPDGLQVDFTGGFVPLVPLGTEATVLWVLGEKVMATFKGKVYLSSPTLLRLVDVDNEGLSRARILLVTNTCIPATFTLRKKDNGSDKTLRYPAEILLLNMEQIKLKCALDPPVGEPIYLSAEVDFLTLHNLGLRVREKVALRREENLLLCSIESGGKENFIALSAYAAKLDKEQKAE